MSVRVVRRWRVSSSLEGTARWAPNLVQNSLASDQVRLFSTRRKREPPILRVPAGKTGVFLSARAAAVRVSWASSEEGVEPSSPPLEEEGKLEVGGVVFEGVFPGGEGGVVFSVVGGGGVVGLVFRPVGGVDLGAVEPVPFCFGAGIGGAEPESDLWGELFLSPGEVFAGFQVGEVGAVFFGE